MVIRRKDAQQLKINGLGSKQDLHLKSNVVKGVDPGISASQMIPMLLDYYMVCCCLGFQHL